MIWHSHEVNSEVNSEEACCCSFAGRVGQEAAERGSAFLRPSLTPVVVLSDKLNTKRLDVVSPGQLSCI